MTCTTRKNHQNPEEYDLYEDGFGTPEIWKDNCQEEKIYLFEQQHKTAYMNVLAECKARKELAALLSTVEKLAKPKHLIRVSPNSNVHNHLDALETDMSNFSEVIAYIKAQIALQSIANKPFQIRPIILVGEPGCGKSLFLSNLAKILQLPFSVTSLEGTTTGSAISGLTRKFSSGSMGCVAKQLALNDVANGIIFLDEIDKAVKSPYHPSPLDVLHAPWEENSSQFFQDEFLEFPINAQYINWFAAANSLDNIPASILSRANVYHIKQPSAEQLKKICQNIYAKLRTKWGIENCSSSQLSDSVVNLLTHCSPRAITRLLEKAMGNAAIANSQCIQIKPRHINLLGEYPDIYDYAQTECDELDEPEKRKSIVFLH